MRTNNTSGFTLIEVLLATIILVLLLAFAAILLSQGSSAHRIINENSSEQEVLDSVSQVLMYDFRLAGYQGPTTQPTTLNQAITRTSNSVTIHYALEADPDRPYEITGSQRITYAVQDGVLTRCHALAASPSTCIGGLVDLADGIISFTADTSSLNGYGVAIEIQRTPYGCDDSDCATTYNVRIPFPQPLRTGAPQ